MEYHAVCVWKGTFYDWSFYDDICSVCSSEVSSHFFSPFLSVFLSILSLACMILLPM